MQIFTHTCVCVCVLSAMCDKLHINFCSAIRLMSCRRCRLTCVPFSFNFLASAFSGLFLFPPLHVSSHHESKCSNYSDGKLPRTERGGKGGRAAAIPQTRRGSDKVFRDWEGEVQVAAGFLGSGLGLAVLPHSFWGVPGCFTALLRRGETSRCESARAVNTPVTD